MIRWNYGIQIDGGVGGEVDYRILIKHVSIDEIFIKEKMVGAFQFG